MTADEILKIKNPERLFVSNIDLKTQFHKLAKKYHPDKNPGNETVFTHINNLYQKALIIIKKGTWGKGLVEEFELMDSTHLTVNYIHSDSFELGKMFIGENKVTYILDEKYSHLAHKIKTYFKFNNKKMKDQISSYLPLEYKFHNLKSGVAVGINKRPDLIRLKDLHSHFNGRIPAKHAVWILGTLMNLSCYLKYQNMSHQDISMDTYFIDPKKHTGALLGGWWYLKAFNETVTNVPKRTYECLPFQVKTSKKASDKTDLELIRALGREMLGDHTGRNLNVPKPLQEWLNSVAHDSAFNDYGTFITMREKLGSRVFVELNVGNRDIYETV